MNYFGRISENHDRNETKPMTDSGYITETAMDHKIWMQARAIANVCYRYIMNLCTGGVDRTDAINCIILRTKQIDRYAARVGPRNWINTRRDNNKRSVLDIQIMILKQKTSCDTRLQSRNQREENRVNESHDMLMLFWAEPISYFDPPCYDMLWLLNSWGLETSS